MERKSATDSRFFQGGAMKNPLLTHAACGLATALLASGATYVALVGWPDAIAPVHAQAQPANTGVRQIELFKTTMDDVLGRVVTVRRTERDPGNGSTPHRHPGSHIFGYVLEGTYEVKIGDGPVQRLAPGETFYEPPGALHAVSRNGSSTQPVKYLIVAISDPTKPQTVQEAQTP
jgi:quercetin dioxygenase-like cupin family protein